MPLHEGGLLSVVRDGVRWIYAFSDEQALARFAAHWELRPSGGVEYQALHGARLLDVVVPATGEPTGIALDVADAEAGGCLLFPPVRGIVPEAAAVDVSTGEATA
ncbi:SseB family protein [Streptomyces olivaceiscleroticus]|uniref:SseB family protein n=1 Tax=Streptomyces olivaceiscleroticus TaxID=68245 RepID=UPI0031F82342